MGVTDQDMQTSERRLGITQPDRRAHLLAFILAALWLSWLCVTSRDVGIPRDESIYFYAADRFAEWWSRLLEQGWGAFSPAEIKRGFAFNHEHPMLMKSLFGLSHEWLYRRWGIISDPILAYRLPTMVMSSALIYCTTLLAVALRGLWAGAVAGLLLMGMPRLFFHAHLSCFDAPVTLMWLAITLAYLGALTRRRWVIGAGVILGLGLATKLNTFFAPFTLLLISVFHIVHVARAERPALSVRIWFKRYAWIAASLTFLGLGVFWAHWPWLYHDTLSRMGAYIGFHARHVHYPVDYLGHLYYGPPFPIHFPLVFTAFTLPVATLCLFACGATWTLRAAWRRWIDRADGFCIELFLLMNALIPVLIIAWPTTPIFGGTKHWMPAMPYFAVLGGIGFVWLCEGIRALRLPTWRFMLASALLAPGLWLTHEYGAHGPAWYNSVAGGIPGAAELRMPRNFWGYSSVEMIDWLNRSPRERRSVFWHNATGIAVHHYRAAGWLDRRISSTGDWTYPYAEWSLYHDQREKLPEEIDLWWAHGSSLPVEGFFIDGVQQIGVYASPQARERLIRAGASSSASSPPSPISGQLGLTTQNPAHTNSLSHSR